MNYPLEIGLCRMFFHVRRKIMKNYSCDVRAINIERPHFCISQLAYQKKNQLSSFKRRNTIKCNNSVINQEKKRLNKI